MKSLLLIALSVALLSCNKEPISTEQTNNSDIKVSFLFEVDGCKVYRFYDRYAVYVTTCPGGAQYQHDSGDSQTHVKSITQLDNNGIVQRNEEK